MADYEETSKIAGDVSKELKFENEDFKKEFDKEMDKLKKSRKPNIAIVGPTNTGKSTLVNTLFGYDIVKTENIPGCTRKNYIKEQKYGMMIMDTPGYGSGDKEDRIEAKNAIKEADLVIVVYNVMVGLTEPGLAPLQDSKDLDKKVIIVLNQTDLADFKQRDEQRNFLREEGYENIVEVSALTGAGMDNLIDKIYNYLPKECKMDFMRSVITDRKDAEERIKKEIEKKLKKIEEKQKRREKLSDSEKEFVENADEFIKKTKERVDSILDAKSKIVNRYIFGAGAAAAGIGALPLPGSDIIPLNIVQAALIVKIGLIYEAKLKTKTVLGMIGTLSIDELFRGLFRQLIKVIPGVGSVIGASVAAAGTIAIGFVAKIILSSDNLELDNETFKKVYENVLPEIKRALRPNKDFINNLAKEKNTSGLESIFEKKIHEENLLK